MKLLLLTSLAAVPWLCIATVAAACLGSILWAFISAEGIVACLAIASRTWDAVKVQREWEDSRIHPRL